jgi:squalene-hopene/tetraprenyl-beta-curcumene cyclase
MTVAPPSAAPQRALAKAALDRARGHVLDRQDQRGWWSSGHYVHVGFDAEELLFRQFASVRTDDVTAAAASWVRSRQEAGGSWAADRGDRPDLTVSVLAYMALRLAGDSPDAYHMAMAAGWIRDAGGVSRAGVRARIWLAAFGYIDWSEVPVPPPEAVYLPASVPVRMPGAPGWGRATLVPLAVMAATDVAKPLPFGLEELRVEAGGCASPGRPMRRVSGLTGIDLGLRAYRLGLGMPAIGARRAAALRRCGDWIAAAQRPDGSWPGSWSGRLFALIALQLLGRQADDQALARGLSALDGTATWSYDAGGQYRCQQWAGGDVTATALAVSALADGGLNRDHSALSAAAMWLIDEELGARARWLAGGHEAGPSTGPACGVAAGVEEAASVVCALRRVTLPAAASQLPVTTFALRWLASLQRKDGGWGRFAAGRGSPLTTRLPLFDLGEIRDESSAEMTSTAVLAFAAGGQPGSRQIRRGATWLLRVQLADGSWPGPLGTGDVLATCAALSALIAAGIVATKVAVARAVGWLLERQSDSDGGWGESRLATQAKTAQSSPLPTARAVSALMAAGDPDLSEPVKRGIGFLVMSQQADGSWAGPPGASEAAPGGQPAIPGLAPDWREVPDMQALTAALSALGRYVQGTGRSPGNAGSPARAALMSRPLRPRP